MTRLLGRLRHRDDGITMVELVVGMAILAVVMSGVLGAVHALAGQYVKAGAIGASTTDTTNVFLRLEKEARYAKWIYTPGPGTTTPADYYMEILYVGGDGSSQCAQWRIVDATDQLQLRTWTAGSTPGTTWTTLARNVANNASNPPFAVYRPGDTIPAATPVPTPSPSASSNTSDFQQLNVSLKVASSGAGVAAAQRVTTYFALNSKGNTTVPSACATSTGVPRP